MIRAIFDFVKNLSPLQKEILRLSLCIAAAFVFNMLLIFGVDPEGNFLEWAKKPVSILTSDKLLFFMFKVVLPLFAYTLFKAWLLNVLKEFRGLLGFIGTQITGALYCAGLIFFSLALHAARFEDDGLNTTLLFNSGIIFVCGFVYFYIFQSAIQKTMSPQLRGV